MYFERFYEPTLAQASYLIGCQATGESIVVDPNRDFGSYVAAAAAAGLRVTHVAETHIHADFVSGARELARHAGARLLLSGEGGTEWQYAFAADSGASLLRDGDVTDVGRVSVRAMHTPGHAPEHLSFVVTDTERGESPVGVLTGDFVFVGDVGRPDLLERVAGQSGSMESSAHDLFRALRRLGDLPDHVQLWPGHGAGSACGKSLGAMPASTLGYERLFNWALAEGDEDRFVRTVLQGQPETPAYFGVMKRVNRDGPPMLGTQRAPRQLPAEALAHALGDSLVIDTRSPERFAAGHATGTVNVPLGSAFAPRVASLLPFERTVFLVADGAGAERVPLATRDLTLVGVDRVGGWFDARVLDVWAARHGALEKTASISVSELARRLGRGDPLLVLDVRGRAESDAGRMRGATNVPLPTLAQEVERVREIAAGRPVVVHCQGGTRSAIAASVLQASGLTNVMNLSGGMAAWQAAGLPMERAADGA